MYDWVLRWADSPYSVAALAILAFAESSFFPIPPDILLIAMCVGAARRSFFFATVCSIGSILGGMFGYWIGAHLFQPLVWPVIDFMHWTEHFNRGAALYRQYDVWVVTTAAFSPIPYKVFTILAGFVGLDFGPFVLASVIGRCGRFFIVAGLIYLFGPKIKDFIDRYFNTLTIAFMGALILGFAAVGLFKHEGRVYDWPRIERLIDHLDEGDDAARTETVYELRDQTGEFFGYNPRLDVEHNRKAIQRWAEWMRAQRGK